MDHVIGFNVPGSLERLHMILVCLQDLMTSLLTVDERNHITELLKQIHAGNITAETETGRVVEYIGTDMNLMTETDSRTTRNNSTKASVYTSGKNGHGNNGIIKGFSKPKVSAPAAETVLMNGTNNNEVIDSPVRVGDQPAVVAVTVVAKKGATRKSIAGSITHSNNNSNTYGATSTSTVASKNNDKLDPYEEEQYNIKLCLTCLVEMSEGWSFREIKKLMQNILSRVLSTER